MVIFKVLGNFLLSIKTLVADIAHKKGFTINNFNLEIWVIRATKKPMLLVFRATRKLMLWYLEQQDNSCFVFRATRKSMLKVIRATRKSLTQFQGPIFLETWDWSQIS